MGNSIGTRNALDAGLLVLRIGVGIMFVLHGAPHLGGGVEKWTQLGEAVSVFGITFCPAFWSFMGSFSEFPGGIMLVLGLLFRPFCVLLVITMIVAAALHISQGDGFIAASHAAEMGIVFFSMLISGPGRWSVSRIIPPLRNRVWG